jgi:tetratricopeptide (TPR) repeat protein
MMRLDELLASGRPEAVVRDVRSMLASGEIEAHNVWRMRQRLAVALLDLGKSADAVAELEAALKDAPDDPALHLNLGRALWRLDRRGRAIAEYGAAVELAPERWLWRLEYAEALLDLGIRRDALRQIKQARMICGDCSGALTAEVNAHLDLDDPAGALDALLLLFYRRPGKDVRRLLVMALWESGDAAGVAALLDSVAVSDLTGDEMMFLIQSDRRLKRADRALAWVRGDRPILPDRGKSEPDFWAIASEICLVSGHPREALTAIDRALAEKPEVAIYHHNRAVILMQLGRDAAAEAALAEARRLDPSLWTTP